jgi:hypothetical protein
MTTGKVPTDKLFTPNSFIDVFFIGYCSVLKSASMSTVSCPHLSYKPGKSKRRLPEEAAVW